MKKLCILFSLLIFAVNIYAKEKGTIHIYCQSKVKIYLDNFYKGESKSKHNGRILKDVRFGKHFIRLQKGLQKEEFTFELKDTLLNVISKDFKVSDDVVLPETNLEHLPVNEAEFNAYVKSDTLQVYVDEITRLSNVTITHFEPLQLSDSAKNDGGKVWMEGKINQNGLVVEANVGIPSTNEELNEAALNSAYHCAFNRGNKTSNEQIWVCWIIDIPYNKSENNNGENQNNESPDDDYQAVKTYPEMIEQETPVYPRIAKQIGLEGLVWVKALVDKNGDVKKAVVGKSSGIYLLDKSAINAAYDNKFKPGMLDGEPVNVWVAYKVNFELK